MNKKKRKVCLAFFMAAMLFTGCGANKNYEETSAAESSSEESYDINTFDSEMTEDYDEASGYEAEGNDSSGADAAETAVETNRKLIKTINLELETLEYEKTIAFLEKSVSECGGYIESSSLEGSSIYSSYSERYGSFTVRIPKDKTDGFIQGMDENTNIRRKSENTEDITLQYVDTESHKEALKVEQERLLEILEKAETVEEIISLESRLSQVRYELGSYESTLRTYDNLVDYTTICIEVNEVQEITEPPKQSAGERMIFGFLDSVKNIGSGVKECIIWFVIHIPYLIMWAVIIGVVILIVRIIKKRRKKKKENQVQNQSGKKEE